MITREHFVGALAIQHDLDAVLGRQAEDAILRVNAGAAKWLVLDGDQSIQIGGQIAGTEPDFVNLWRRFVRLQYRRTVLRRWSGHRP